MFFNHGCELLTGWKPEQVIGRACDFTSEPDETRVESLLGALCPPEEALLGTPTTKPVQLISPDRVAQTRMIHFLPLPIEDGSIRVLGILLPVQAPVRFSLQDESLQLHADLAAVKTQVRRSYDLQHWVATTSVMRRVSSQVAIAKGSTCPVFLTGDRGTGKHHVARLIHYQGVHRLRTFAPLDCAALPAEEVARVANRFFVAEEGDPKIPVVQPGTLFLQNVDRLPRDVQEFLATQLSQQPRSDGRRMMAASRLDLDAIGPDLLLTEFRELLEVFRIALPPLRVRLDEIGLLAQSILEGLNRGQARQRTGFSPDVLSAFRRYNWPGNVGELELVIRKACEVATGPLIEVGHLPFRFRTGTDAQRVPPAEALESVPLEAYLELVERQQIEAALLRAKGNKSIAAQSLKIPRAKLYRRMEALGLDAGDEPGE
jgi:DNA-binding NtrC family response regulator